ncbi:uncharacterized protein [Engystomops pustulosus]|uniref:uncharacterized protein n=1 Tax=Engystomops pustulosus TaxID=76066 RepID=UPI003AFA73B1
MGAKCAPSYANLFLGWWEENVVYRLEAYKTKVSGWFRYIDDILLLWTGSSEDCVGFISELNNNPWNIKLTSTLSTTTVDFLDISISYNHPTLTTSLFRKQTATNNLLHFSSFHPRHLKNGIPTGQFLRLKRNCSDQSDFRRHARELTHRFQERGYPQKIISGAFTRAKLSERKDLLQTKSRTMDSRPRTPRIMETLKFGITYIVKPREWSMYYSVPVQNSMWVKPHKNCVGDANNICPPSIQRPPIYKKERPSLQ